MILGAAPEDNFKPSPEATKLPNGWLAAGLNKVATALGGPLMSSRDGCLGSPLREVEGRVRVNHGIGPHGPRSALM